jgi:alkanesulfonate monooxygenase SsuD/methylene tetrahydromethanopterin reductase-like flavin-dependent oxidoreductase (luciferase family)
MKFDIRNTSFVYPNDVGDIWEDTKAHIQRAEQDGFDSFWVMDHFYQLPMHGSVGEPFLDAWTVLPALTFNHVSKRKIRQGYKWLKDLQG